jgi:hypothetical protein
MVDRDSIKFKGLKSLNTKGSYKTNVDKVKKSTSKYFGISNGLTRDSKIQSGKLVDFCL